MNAVIYLRYSSHGQREESIEGQRKVITEYAKREGYVILREYIDRAKSASTDTEKRENFLKMIADSARHKFEYVLIYSTDRFARNRYDSAHYKAQLKKNGVIVKSATEPITNDPAGVMIEGVLESVAEYYSAELSAKVRRGLEVSKSKNKFLGGHIPIGYAVNEHKEYIINPVTAPVVKECFSLFAAGTPLKQIAETLYKQHGSVVKGNVFNTINRILSNKMYIGYYTRGGCEVKDGVPRIVSDEIFGSVQQILNKKKKAPAMARAYEDYILTTKLFCGYDRQMMVGTGGTSKSGKVHHYYSFKNAIRKNGQGCKKKNVQKNYIEDFIVNEARKQLTDENIKLIVQAVCEASKRENDAPRIAEIKRIIKETNKAIENLLVAVERGENLDIIMERLTLKKQEKTNLEIALAKAQMDTVDIDEKEVKFFFYQLQKGNVDDERSRKALIAIFINEVYLYDDKVRIIFNATDRPITIDCSLLDEIESLENAGVSGSGRCSYMKDTAPPQFVLKA